MGKRCLITAGFVLESLTIFIGNATYAGGFYLTGKISTSTLVHMIERNTGGFILPAPDTSGVTF